MQADLDRDLMHPQTLCRHAMAAATAVCPLRHHEPSDDLLGGDRRNHSDSFEDAHLNCPKSLFPRWSHHLKPFEAKWVGR
jgi:hypothetical protein